MTELRTDPRYRWRIKGLTALNLEVNARHEACNANGGCKAGGQIISRDGMLMAVCVRCDVPIRTLALSLWRRRAAVWGA